MDLKYLTISCDVEDGTAPQAFVDAMKVRYRGRPVQHILISSEKGSYGVCYKVQFYYSAVQPFAFVLKICNGKMKRGILEENLIRKRINSNNIVPIKRVNNRAVVMPYYALRLDSLIADNRVNEHIPDISSFVERVGLALKSLRDQHLWYLDLKPAHIALSENGDPILLDVGCVVTDSNGTLSSTYPPPRYHHGCLPKKQISRQYVKQWQTVQLHMLELSMRYMTCKPFLAYEEDEDVYGYKLLQLEHSPRYRELGAAIRNFEPSFINSNNHHNDTTHTLPISRNTTVV